MEIIDLIKHPSIIESKYLLKKFEKFEQLIKELKTRDLPDPIIETINIEVEALNHFKGERKNYAKMLRHSLSHILKTLENELGLVPKNHYQNSWMALGMSLGVMLGIVFGSAVDNNGMLAIGLPIGMVIGMSLGAKKDKKLAAEGKELEVEI